MTLLKLPVFKGFTRLALVLSVVAACAEDPEPMEMTSDDSEDETDDEGSGSGVYASTIQPIWTQSCALAACHDGTFVPDLREGSYDAIVGVASPTTTVTFIEPGSSEDSYLWLKITGAPGITGLPMPFTGDPLPASTQSTIEDWILDGAME